jgi:hypothetical protein
VTRTFVISDAHGSPELIQNALDHGGFVPGGDSFVYAGDLLDRGPDAEHCIALVERHATEVLLGSHDVAAMLDFNVFPQNPESLDFKPLLTEKVLASDRSRAWKVATCVEGVLITHAGISQHYSEIFVEKCRSDPARLAKRLNREFRALVAREPRVRDWYDHDLLGDLGPFWYRPWPYSDLRPLPGCVQVAGHTPPLGHMEGTGFHMIDPTSYDEWEDRGRYRYAVIEGGVVRVEEGTLTASGSALPPGESASALCA